MSNEIVEVWLKEMLVGRIALTSKGLCAFEYDPTFLKDGFSISPFALPLQPGVFVAEPDPFDGNFGVFDDSLPDGWGALLLDRFLKEQGKNIETLSILDRLSLIGVNGRGALEYRPDRSLLQTAEFSNFDQIAQECEKLLQSREEDETSIVKLYQYAGSSGGARPKVFARFDDREWLVKFKATADPINVGETEYRCSILAKECGIEMPETRLLQGRYFAVERFDRVADGKKVHTVSASGIANAYYRIPSLDYSDLFLICKSLMADATQTLQLFRRMVFNVLIKNKDDHSKNFAFQYTGEKWILSPAYDLLPSIGFNNQHTTSIGGKGNPTQEDLLDVAHKADVPKRKAVEVYEEIADRVRSSGILTA